LELVELALLPQQMEHLEPPHNMGWCLLAVEVAVLRMETVEPEQEQQQSPQLLQPQPFLILAHQPQPQLKPVMQVVEVVLAVLLD
jgi:hypothetical protein